MGRKSTKKGCAGNAAHPTPHKTRLFENVLTEESDLRASEEAHKGRYDTKDFKPGKGPHGKSVNYRQWPNSPLGKGLDSFWALGRPRNPFDWDGCGAKSRNCLSGGARYDRNPAG